MVRVSATSKILFLRAILPMDAQLDRPARERYDESVDGVG